MPEHKLEQRHVYPTGAVTYACPECGRMIIHGWTSATTHAILVLYEGDTTVDHAYPEDQVSMDVQEEPSYIDEPPSPPDEVEQWIDAVELWLSTRPTLDEGLP